MKTEFDIRLRDEHGDPASLDRRLRIALKRLLRSLGLRCVKINPTPQDGQQKPHGGDKG